MKIHPLLNPFVFSVLAFVLIVADCGVVYDNEAKFGSEIARRILHQPLFPSSSAPPPDTELPPPSPPSPDVPEQPFFPEVPSTPYQSQQPPPSPSSSANVNGGSPIPTATQPSKPGKKVAIAISVGIVTLGMLSALAFFLYRHKAKHARETQKLVDGGRNGGPRSFQEDSAAPPSSFLYIGTVEPSRRSNSESNSGGSAPTNSSPYRKLDSMKRSERYRPSPELHPLPPLPKPLPPSANSPSPSASPSSSDEESRDMAFYTPHGSSISNEDSYYTPSSRSIYSNGHSTGSVPHSKRTSPRSRLATAALTTPSTVDSSFPETKQVLIPSIKQKSPRQTHPVITPPKVLENVQIPSSYSPARPRFSSPPQLPSTKVFQAIHNDNSPHRIKAPPPPPPPPPPPRAPTKETADLSTPRKRWNLDTESVSMTKETLKKQQFRTQGTKLKIAEETSGKSADSSEKFEQENTDESRTKLKPLHWDKVRASSDRATVWDQLKSSSFQINEDMIEHLFGCNSATSAPKEPTRRSVLPPVEKENRVLDPKKSQNIAILLRALNVTRDEVSEALLDGNPESLGAELLETLVKMAPTKEEEIKLREYSGDISKLGTAERFLKTILDIPFAFRRVEAMLYRASFDTEVNYLKNSFQILEGASEELKSSRLFLKLLEAVLRTGNRMNVGTNRGEAKAFKLDTLLKLADVKGTDGKTTLLHFVVQEIIRSEGVTDDPTKDDLRNNQQSCMKDEDFRKQGLQVVAGLSRDLGNVKKAAGMDSDVLSGYVSKLETGLEKVRAVMKCERPETRGKFFELMKCFLKEAEEEISRVKAEERHALLLVKEVTEYFHGNAAKEEAHPLRIFMIVRDFLTVLDNVCKEVRTMHERTVMGSARSFRIPPSASLPVLNRYNVRHDSSDDSSSP